MNRTAFAAALLCAAIASPYPVLAQVVGDPCPADPQFNHTVTSKIPTQGVIQCIPNGQGQYYWQAEGAGIALYDATAACSVPGQLRWNGSAVQYCNATGTWSPLGGGAVGKLYWTGNSNTFWCDPGYHVTTLHFDCGCSNNATWFECQAN